MKRIFLSVLGLTLIFTLVLSFNAQAQEEENIIVPVEVNAEYDPIEDRTFSGETDRFSTLEKSVPREQPATIQTRQKSNKGNEKSVNATAKTEEDPMSFNFLYYIIQKFKISDIVE